MSHDRSPEPLGSSAKGPVADTDEVARLRKVGEAQAAALSNLALTAQLLAEQVEDMRRRQLGLQKPTTPPSS